MAQDCTGRFVTRTAGTEADYASRILGLQKAAQRDNCDAGIAPLVAWFCRQHEHWAESTVRQYRAAIVHALETEGADSDRHDRLVARLYAGPTPKIGGPKQTSARKRKSLKRDEFLRLMQHLKQPKRADDHLIRAMLGFGVALFLRPVEYLGASVDGDTLIVPNAKATNGRANGAVRKRLLDMAPKTKASLVKFLQHFNEVATAAESWKKFHDRLSSRLARLCKALNIRRVSFYTLRHVGMATAKSWMEPREVAAAAGHASIRTATSHYAKRRSGWVGLRLAGKPLPESVALVRGELKLFCPREVGLAPK